MHQMIVRLANEVPLEILKFYLDDGIIVGTHSDVLKALAIILEESVKIGLSLNLAKCNLDVDLGLFPAEITRVYGGLSVLGIPIGDEEYLKTYEDPQVAYVLLRDCRSFPRLVHLLRSLPPQRHRGRCDPLRYTRQAW
eukprot:PhF_6_TR5412/c0_g1_i1/m.7718